MFYESFCSTQARAGRIFDLKIFVKLLNDSHPQKQLFCSLNILSTVIFFRKVERVHTTNYKDNFEPQDGANTQ